MNLPKPVRCTKCGYIARTGMEILEHLKLHQQLWKDEDCFQVIEEPVQVIDLLYNMESAQEQALLEADKHIDLLGFE